MTSHTASIQRSNHKDLKQVELARADIETMFQFIDADEGRLSAAL